MRILRYVTGLGGWGMLTFMLTCVTCTSYVTSLGWRWMNSKMKSLHYGGHRSSLERPCSNVSWKKTRRVFRNKFPVIYRLSFKNHFKVPGNFEPILGHESVVSLWRKRHSFKKTSKRWRGFPPDGTYIYTCNYTGYIYIYIQTMYNAACDCLFLDIGLVCLFFVVWSLWSDISLWWHLFTFLVTCLKSALGGARLGALFLYYINVAMCIQVCLVWTWFRDGNKGSGAKCCFCCWCCCLSAWVVNRYQHWEHGRSPMKNLTLPSPMRFCYMSYIYIYIHATRIQIVFFASGHCQPPAKGAGG